MEVALTRLVWQRARNSCEYCQMPQAADDAPFEIDYIIARKHGWPTTAGNLCLSCYYCNVFKGSVFRAWTRNRGNLPRCSIPAATNGAGISAGRVPIWLAARRSAASPSPCFISMTSTVLNSATGCSPKAPSLRREQPNWGSQPAEFLESWISPFLEFLIGVARNSF